MKKLFNYTLPVVALCVLASCSEDDSINATADPSNGRELIAFSQEGSAMTRAGFTRTGFDSQTKVVIRIKAEEKDGTGVRYTQAVATAQPQTTTDDDCNTEYKLAGTHSHLNYASGQERFWDDAFGRKSQLTVYAVAVPNKTDAPQITDGMLDQTGQEAVSTATNPNWFNLTTPNTEQTTISWTVSTKQTSETRGKEDLAYSNNIKDGETINKGRYHQAWSTTDNDWAKSMELGRMIWQSKNPDDATVTTGKFDQGHLVFKHALSWITIVFKEGEGFNYNSNTDFIWTNKGDNAQAVALKGFPTSGKFDISNGTWSDMTTTVDITQMQETEGTYTVTETPSVNGKTRTLDCYVLPGTTLYDVNNNVLEFEIDNAQYKVKGSQIANAIRDYYKTGGDHASEAHADEYRSFKATQAGKHYIINLTVGKKKIDNITAAIIDWETVNSSDATPDNTYCSFSFEDRNARIEGETNSGNFSIYRAAKTTTEGKYILSADVQANYAWETGYDATAATKEWVDGTPNGHWSTNWSWEDNQTYYHFRAIGELTTKNEVSFTTDGTNGDFFAITSGAISGSTYKDYIWGAPFTANSGAKFKYDNTGATPTGFAKNGDTYQISRAIGATDNQIKMLLFHMTSQIYVNVRTTDNSKNDAVVLCDTKNTQETTDDVNATTVEILNFLPNGKVLMGNGLVTATDGARTTNVTMTAGTYHPAAGTEPNKTEDFSYGIVPQKLTGNWGTIGLRITTPDGNQYEVKDLSTCKGSVSTTNLSNPYSGSEGAYSITEWFPHYKYTYTITIKKTGIQNITAAVLPWETVTGDLGTIDLEN